MYRAERGHFMDGTITYQTDLCELHIGNMQFTIINRRPIYIKDMLEKTKTEIEKQLFGVFKKYV